MWLFPSWLLFLNGIFLFMLGFFIAKNRMQTQEKIASFRKNSGLLWSFLCISMGIILLMMGFGYIPQPGMWLQQNQETRIIFPTDR